LANLAIIETVTETGAPYVELAREGGVRVGEYRCRARRGDAPLPEVHGAASIAIVRAGTFVYRGRKTAVLRPGALLLGNPGDAYACSHEHDGGDVCLTFELDARVLEQVRSAALRRGSRREVFSASVLPSLPRIEALRRRCEESLRGDAAWGFEELGLELAGTVLQQLAAARDLRADEGSNATDRRRAQVAAELIESGTAQLSELATHVGVSAFHLLRIFRRELGVTPRQYAIRMRLRRAIDLLRDTRIPITEIAFDSGFGDVSHFVKTFTREIGCSPSRFRRGRRERG
jgi:AraC family transcriptional regulator